MTAQLSEQIDFYAALARRAIDTFGRAARADREHTSRLDTLFRKLRPGQAVNHLGDDLEPKELRAIEQLFSGKLTGISPYREAQLRELAFWRWVAFEGYGNGDPRAFPLHQEHFMVSTFYRTGWSRAELAGATILELGCGPLGMIEYMPARTRTAFDPLNRFYSQLYRRYRGSDINYLSERQELVDLPESFDFGICHNMIDHTDEPEWWFDTLFRKLRPGGRFLFQVNVSRADLPQSDEHRRMHPSPFLHAQIIEWLGAKSDDFQHVLAETPSTDGEQHFLAWGLKTRDEPVTYVNLLRGAP